MTSQNDKLAGEIGTFSRKPFFVDAVQVTNENMQKVAEWCMGEVLTTKNPESGREEHYIRVRVHRPLTERQTRAFVDDWILYAGTGYKVYTDKAFEKSFEAVTKAPSEGQTAAAQA